MDFFYFYAVGYKTDGFCFHCGAERLLNLFYRIYKEPPVTVFISIIQEMHKTMDNLCSNKYVALVSCFLNRSWRPEFFNIFVT